MQSTLMKFSKRNEFQIINYYLVRPQVVCQVMAHLYEAKPADFFLQNFNWNFRRIPLSSALRKKFRSKKITNLDAAEGN